MQEDSVVGNLQETAFVRRAIAAPGLQLRMLKQHNTGQHIKPARSCFGVHFIWDCEGTH